MVIGGFVGLGLWRVLEGVAPGMPSGPAPFMVVGMIACFGSIAHAPLGLILMVAEMTGSLTLLPPAMVAIGLATLIVGERTIYESQLRSRADSPAHRAAFGMPLLSAVPVAEVMAAPTLLLRADMPTTEARAMITEAHLPGGPVVDDNGRFVGVLSADAEPSDANRAAGAADPSYPTVSSDRGLDYALDAIVSADISWVPVVDDQHVVGVIAMKEIMAGYQRALRRSLHLVADVRGQTTLVEATVADTSPLAGTTVATAPWPPGTFALSIDRNSHLIAPQPETTVQAGDVIVAVVPIAAEAQLRDRLNGVAKDCGHSG
jgi:CBS domain-containing protein